MISLVRIGLFVGALTIVAAASATPFRVTVTNLAPSSGTFLTPVWVGFHNGTFDSYDSGAASSAALERLAEDGDVSFLMTAFSSSGAGTVQGALGGGPIAPGTSATFVFDLDPFNPNDRFFSYASMVIPSNDAFIANGNPLAFQLFDAGGNFTPLSFIVSGGMVLDAGTEVNDEAPANTAFFGQAAPNTGTAQGGVVGIHPGFLAAAPGNILGSAMFAGADFKASGYNVAQITIEAVPEPSTWGLMTMGLAGLAALRRRRAR